MFERRLSKFNAPPPPSSTEAAAAAAAEKPRKPSHVDKLTKKFSQTQLSEEAEREVRKRRDEFERKRSGFMSGSLPADEIQRKISEPEESRNRLQKMKLMFEDRDAALAAAEDELNRKRREEEEAEQRRKDFEAKSSLFKKMSNAGSHER